MESNQECNLQTSKVAPEIENEKAPVESADQEIVANQEIVTEEGNDLQTIPLKEQKIVNEQEAEVNKDIPSESTTENSTSIDMPDLTLLKENVVCQEVKPVEASDNILQTQEGCQNDTDSKEEEEAATTPIDNVASEAITAIDILMDDEGSVLLKPKDVDNEQDSEQTPAATTVDVAEKESPKEETETASEQPNDYLDTSDNIEIITTNEPCNDPDKIIAEICGEANDSTNSSESFYVTTEESSMNTEDESSKGKEVPLQTVYVVSEEVLMESSKENDDDDDLIKQDEEREKKVNVKKETGLKIPNHVLGRNVQNPNQEVTRNGRPPKPRIGVTVPHRNLTSQIVTKHDIAEVLLERQKARNTSKVYGSNTLFARKLTKTLASRIIPRNKPKPELANADLISILEGTEDDVEQPEPPEINKKAESSTSRQDDNIEVYSNNEFVKQLEQQLALKQLNELQMQKPIKRRRADKSDTDAELKEEKEILVKVKQKAEDSLKPPVKEETVEPKLKFKANVPVKTYGRKWKSESSSNMVPPPPPSVIESDLNENQAIYVTKKSSRIVKRKVIWDPDEMPSRFTTAKIIKITPEKASIKTEKNSQSTSTPAKQINTEKVIIKHIEKSPKLVKTPKHEKEKIIITKSPTKKVDKSINVVRVKSEKEVPRVKQGTPKKKLTEVDKLLMDEGAVNMLYSVKNEEAPVKKRKKNVISLDVVEKELRHKTNEILNDLQTNTGKSSIGLRKKDSTTPPMKKPLPGAISRQKSKDSTRSSIQTPPASPVTLHPEASRIIRRHSSDSFSSEGEAESEQPSERVTRSKSTPEDKQKQNEKFNKLIETDIKIKIIERDHLLLRHFGTFLNVIFKYDKKSFLTVQMMKEVIDVLEEIEENDAVNVVLFTSNGKSFCQGINYKALTAEKESTKKALAKEMGNTIRKFLTCLATRSKLLIAGLHGDVVGLGVMILPLFDIIIANESTTLSTPYGKLGCIPEATTFLNSGNFLHKALISELLYSSRKLLAAEALKMGLITRVLCTPKFEEELLNTVKQISKQSPQFMLTTKRFLQQDPEDFEAALNEETETLISHWISAECQKNFASYS